MEALGRTASEIRDASAEVQDASVEADAPATPRPLLLDRARFPLAATGLVVALYMVLRPENFGLIPNPLDPMFYTGYAINFDDIMNAVRDRHYFVSRWSSYYPTYLSTRWFGPDAGRLLPRLAVSVGIVSAVWRVRPDWRWSQRILVATLIVTTPMFVRAFFTDYVEWTVVGLGVWLVALSVRRQQTVWTTITIGLLAGMIVVANPYGITVVGLPVSAAVLFGWSTWPRRIAAAVSIGALGAGVILGGLLLFRVRYGIDNVYQPTFDFVRSFSGADPLRSPRLEWLGRFTWLYATPFLVVSILVLLRRRIVVLDRPEALALTLCGLQYAYQWFDQFGRQGNGLEISYYWSFAYPTFGVALGLMAGRLTDRTGNRTVIGLVVGWILLLVIGVPEFLRLPPNGLALVVLAIALVAAVAIARRWPTASTAVLIGCIGVTQIGAPSYDPTSYHAFNASPRYDELYRRAGDFGERVFDEAVWFADQMDTVPNDASTSFVTLDGWAGTITGLYAPHVTNHVIGGNEDGTRLDPAFAAEIRLGARPVVAVYGEPDAVGRIIDTFPADLGVGEQVLDRTHDGGLGYRLVAYLMPDAAQLPFTLDASVLPRLTGVEVDGAVVVAAGTDQPGFVTYGPYLPLQPGTYRIAVRYRSTAPDASIVGALDVSSPESGTIGRVDLRGTEEVAAERSIVFTVDDPGLRWEFRTSWGGEGGLVVESLTLARG